MDEERYDRERKIYKNYCDQKASCLNEDDEVKPVNYRLMS